MSKLKSFLHLSFAFALEGPPAAGKIPFVILDVSSSSDSSKEKEEEEKSTIHALPFTAADN